MNENAMSFDKLPEAVSFLISEISELKSMLGAAQKLDKNKSRLPIGINEVCLLTAKAKPTIYALVRKRLIPCYKSSKKLYFFEDEIIMWIEGGKRKTSSEIKAEAENYLQNKRR